MSLQPYLPIVLRHDPDSRYVSDPDFHAFKDIRGATKAQLDATGRVCAMKTPTHDNTVYVWIPAENPSAPEELRYFCHGWGLSTYNPVTRRGYTVCSTYVHEILRDEKLATCIVPESTSTILAANEPLNRALTEGDVTLEKINANIIDINKTPAYTGAWGIQPDDIVVWWGQNTMTPWYKRIHNPDSNLICMHTARVVRPVFKADRNWLGAIRLYLSEDTVMSSKNGGEPLQEEISLRALMNDPAYKPCKTIGVYRLTKPVPIPDPEEPPQHVLDQIPPLPDGAPQVALPLLPLLEVGQPQVEHANQLLALINDQGQVTSDI